VNVTLFRNPGYDPKDFVPIINGGVIRNILFAHPSLPATHLQGLIKLGKTKKLPYAFFAPRGTPRAIVDKLNTEIASALQVPAVKERLFTLGFTFTPNTAAQFADFPQKEVVKWGKVVKDPGARVD